MTRWRLMTAVIAGSAGLVHPATAQQAEPARPLVITAENLMAGDARHQALTRQGADPSVLLPGDLVRYRLVFTNTTAVPVRDVEFRDPLPAGLRYVLGSSASDREQVRIDYSIDGGATYSAQPMVEEVVEGERVRRPAPAERYTHIRWQVRGWVEPGARVVAEFRAQLPEPARGSETPNQADGVRPAPPPAR